jgi:hypothetical protein
MIVYDHLDEAAARTKQRIEWLLDLEQSPTTLNTHYYSDYKDKFLAYYKGCRENTDLISKIKASQSSSKRMSNSRAFEVVPDPVTKILAGLAEIGITVKAEDLPRLLPSDPMEAALNIMASVRAYFQGKIQRDFPARAKRLMYGSQSPINDLRTWSPSLSTTRSSWAWRKTWTRPCRTDCKLRVRRDTPVVETCSRSSAVSRLGARTCRRRWRGCRQRVRS